LSQEADQEKEVQDDPLRCKPSELVPGQLEDVARQNSKQHQLKLLSHNLTGVCNYLEEHIIQIWY
jgi:hypothetical protein